MSITPLFADEGQPVRKLDPVLIEVVRECDFKRKPCGECGLPKSNEIHKGSPPRCVFTRRLGCDRCGRAARDPVHYGAPSSLNVFGSGNPKTYWQEKMNWQAILTPLLIASGLPKGLERVMVEGEATFPTRAGRDQGNHRVLIEKALGDALEAGGWLAEDTWEHYEFGNLTASYERGVSATRLMLFPSLPASG
jgi:hypothetical protein